MTTLPQEPLNVIYGLKLVGDEQPVRYVGLTSVGASVRFTGHLQQAGKTLNGRERVYPLYHWLAKHAGDVECVVIEELSSPDELNEREIFWIAELGTFIDEGLGFNLTRGGGGIQGYTWSEESKLRLKAAKEHQKPVSDETRERLRQAALRRYSTPGARDKTSEAMKIAWSKRDTQLEAQSTRATRTLSDDVRKNISVGMTAYWNQRRGGPAETRTPSTDQKLIRRGKYAAHVRCHVNTQKLSTVCVFCLGETY
jgi:hypothetical protein